MSSGRIGWYLRYFIQATSVSEAMVQTGRKSLLKWIIIRRLFVTDTGAGVVPFGFPVGVMVKLLFLKEYIIRVK